MFFEGISDMSSEDRNYMFESIKYNRSKLKITVYKIDQN